mgnify:CR=1 FL=1
MERTPLVAYKETYRRVGACTACTEGRHDPAPWTGDGNDPIMVKKGGDDRANGAHEGWRTRRWQDRWAPHIWGECGRIPEAGPPYLGECGRIPEDLLQL